MVEINKKKKKEVQLGLIMLNCSQSPTFPRDRRDRARLTINGGHLDFQMYRVADARPLGTSENQDGRH